MKKLYLIIILLIASFSASAQNKYYVSTTGNNSNTGLTTTSPFLTIQFAINTAMDNESKTNMISSSSNFLDSNISSGKAM